MEKGQREEARARGGRLKGEGRRQTASAEQWEDCPMPGLVAAAAAAWTRGSVLEAEQKQQETFFPRIRAKTFILYPAVTERGEKSLWSKSTVINPRAHSSRGK